MTSYLFLFGRTPDLSFAELLVFFPGAKRVGDFGALWEGELPIPAHEVIAKLGGTVKIAHIVGVVDTLSSTAIVQHIPLQKRLTFGVSGYGNVRIEKSLLAELKEQLSGRGVSVRFVEPKHGETLSSVTVEKSHVVELVIFPSEEGYTIAITEAVQDFTSWNQRDYGRPHADPKRGMLPPKVSRMIVNIADGARDIAKPLSGKTLLDPFCGMGTILGEAMAMGWNVYGSDQDADVIAEATENLRFLASKKLTNELVTFRVQAGDAVHVSERLDADSIDAIVTEPFMGPTDLATSRKSPKELANTLKGLEKLYIGCLRDWHTVLKPGGRVVMAIPAYISDDHTYTVKTLVDRCESLGYTTLTGPIEYSRPQAFVKRAFYVFRKKEGKK